MGCLFSLRCGAGTLLTLRIPQEGRYDCDAIIVLKTRIRALDHLGLGAGFSGVEVTTLVTAGGLQAFADSVSPELLAMMEEHAAVGGMLSQDGWNLGVSGIVAIIAGVFVWRGGMTAVWVAALTAVLVGGAATQVKHCRTEFNEATGGPTAESMCFQGDIGYFLFVDLGDYANFIPTVMILIAVAAIVLSCRGLFSGLKQTGEVN